MKHQGGRRQSQGRADSVRGRAYLWLVRRRVWLLEGQSMLRIGEPIVASPCRRGCPVYVT